jgi:hypothetical protein
MSLLDALTDLFGAVAYASGRQKRSALPPGRMNETDVVKGTGSPLPQSPGIYRHVDKKTREVVYVGQTDNLRRRQQEHVRSGRLNTDQQFVRYREAKETASKTDLCRTEAEHILRHNPSGNKTRGGNGRR